MGGRYKDTLKARYGKTISIDSVGNFKFNKDSPIQILSASKQLDTTLSYYRMDTAKCKNWELSKNDILHIFKFSKQISGTEWDLNYEVLPCSYKGEFIIGSKKGRYEVNAASFVILIFKDTTIYLGCNLEYKHFLSHPQ